VFESFFFSFFFSFLLCSSPDGFAPLTVDPCPCIPQSRIVTFLDVVMKMEQVGTSGGSTSKKVTIRDCGMHGHGSTVSGAKPSGEEQSKKEKKKEKKKDSNTRYKKSAKAIPHYGL
jgi:hypothetical protein